MKNLSSKADTLARLARRYAADPTEERRLSLRIALRAMAFAVEQALKQTLPKQSENV